MFKKIGDILAIIFYGIICFIIFPFSPILSAMIFIFLLVPFYIHFGE